MEPNSELVTFLYFLMRDHVPVGVIDRILREDVPAFSGEVDLTRYQNRTLAKYAYEIAEQLVDN